jgi:hypothetical protein
MVLVKLYNRNKAGTIIISLNSYLVIFKIYTYSLQWLYYEPSESF